MLIIRLQRVGKRNDPSFRIVLTDSRRAPKSGGFLEILGSYNARMGKPQFSVDRIKHWLSKGVKVSDTIHNLFVRSAIIKDTKRDVASKKNVGKNIQPETPTVQPATA